MEAGSREFAVVVGNGEPPPRELFEAVSGAGALIICADGGANSLAALDVTPDYIVGDLDSVSEQVLRAVPADRRIRVDADNTSTDLVKALNHAPDPGCTLGGAPGGDGRSRRSHSVESESAQDIPESASSSRSSMHGAKRSSSMARSSSTPSRDESCRCVRWEAQCPGSRQRD